MRLSHEFGPLFDQDSKVLVLGSFPSVKSREKQFYYGHPQNRFWPLLARILGVPVPETIEERRLLALEHGIALWDVIDSCEITGSADSSIRNPEMTDLSLILETAQIRQIFVNGKAAFKLFEKHQKPVIRREAVCLPSTSPANAAFGMDRLYDDWRIIGEYLQEMPDGRAERLRFQDVYHIVRMIPRGCVATYGQIAAMLGNIRWARMVGYALHDNPDGDYTPCYRVVNKEGRVSDAFVFGGRNRQIDLLRADGIEVSDDGYVNMKKYLWKGW